MRLGGVGRAVIVASCFWMAGGTLFIAGGIEDANLRAAQLASDECTKISGAANCSSVWNTVYYTREEGGVWREAAVEATLLLVLALILFGAIYVSIRWVLAGRKRTPLDPVR